MISNGLLFYNTPCCNALTDDIICKYVIDNDIKFVGFSVLFDKHLA